MMNGKTSASLWFPLELVNECRSCRTANEAEELLQRVLSLLAVHNEQAEQEARYLLNDQSTLLPTRMYRAVTNTRDKEELVSRGANSHELWLALELIQGLLCGNNDDEDAAALPTECEHASRDVVMNFMNPLEVHAVVVQAVVFLDTDDQSMSEVDDTDGSPGKEQDLQYRNQSVFFLSTCLLLCTWSLKQLASANQPRKRWKRYRSLVLETLRLFQRNCLAIIRSHGTTLEQMEHWVSLWVHFLLPSSQHLWKKLPIPTSLVWSEWLVGVISVTSTWMEILAFLFPNDPHGEQLALKLFESMEDTILHVFDQGLDTLLLCHPWRECIPDPGFLALANPIEITTTTLELSVAYWTNKLYRPADDISMIDTEWSSFGLALLAKFAWYSHRRPWVYHPRYVWQMWFPHVANLMNFSQTTSSDNNFPANAKFAFWIQEQSIIFLKDLLDTQPTKSLVQGKVGRPLDDPVGTFQLLLNALMESSKRTQITSHNHETSTTPAGIFAICKHLLSKFTPSSHLPIIKKLLETCPHEGLKPKILDLLRPFMLETPDYDDPIWSYLVCLVSDLNHYLHQESESTTIRESAAQPASCRIQDVEDLIDQTEFFVAAIFLLELGLRRSHQNSKSRELAGKLTHHTKMLETLRSSTAKWENLATSATISGEDASPPEQYFRLFLLESALAQLLDLISLLNVRGQTRERV